MKEYMEKYRSHIILMGLFVFLIHGAKLNSNIVGIDTEDLIQYREEFYSGWLDTGRQGLVLLKGLMGNLTFNPYFAGLLTLLCFALAVSVFLMLWDKVGNWGKQQKISVISWTFCGALWISHPIMTEQFYFTLQSAEICISIFLTALALYLVYEWQCKADGTIRRLGKHVWMPLVSILLLLLTFSVYQIFVVVYICGTVSLILLQSVSNACEEQNFEMDRLLFPIVPYASVFLVAFGLNSLVTGCFFQSSDYLDNQILWGKDNGINNFRAILGHVLKSMTGYEGIYYNCGFGILSVLAVVLLLFVVKKRAIKKGVAVVLFFYLFSFLSTPYLMTIVIGGTPAYRSQLVLPMATGFLAYLVIGFLGIFQEGRKLQIGMSALYCVLFVGCIIGLWQQIQTTFSLYYTDSMRYEQDIALARDLIVRIEKERISEGMDEVALVVVGSKPFVGNQSCVEGETIGTSLFDHDAHAEPMYYWSTKRVLGLFHVLGVDYEIAPQDRFDHAIDYSYYMSSWPMDDCVKDQEGIIIVKLSD
ncbi:MAG: glucosyltransferase domain-containing protein [Lachnospiraceae bacterium]|nr:glucosyltransferase domain-containing protein [Lachnospiraceae bacterium]